MKKSIIVLFWLISFICLNALVMNNHKILILSSYSDDYSWQRSVKNAIKDKIKDQKVIVFEENFQSQKLNIPVEAHYDYIKSKYAAQNLKVILCLDDYAFKFITRFDKDIFPDIPVIFCGVNDINPKTLKNYPRFTGVNEKIDFTSTVNLILKLRPSLVNIYMYGDHSDLYYTNKNMIEHQIRQINKPLTYHFIDDKTISDIQKDIQKMTNKDAIVIISSIRDDHKNSIFPYEEMIPYLNINPQVPIFALWDFFLGSGVVGGCMVSGDQQGLMAGDQLNQILNGEQVENIPVVMNSPNLTFFDYNQMGKFKFKVKNIPSDAIIINQPSSKYSIKKEIIWLGNFFFIIILTFFLIFSFQLLREKKIKKALDEHLNFFKVLLNTIPNPIFFRTVNGEIKIYNKAFSDFFGCEEQNLYDKNFYDLIPKNNIFICKEADKSLMNNPPEHSYETLLEINHEEKHIRFDKALVYDNNHNVTGIVGVMTDISERKKSNQAIKDHIQSLEMKNNEMQAFLYTISHDLKSPIITIKGFLGFLYADLEKGDHMKIQRGMRRISDATDKMSELLDDLLALSRVGRNIPLHTSFKMNDSIKEAISLLQSLISESNTQISIQEGMPGIHGDRKRIREVWQNLIENAVKYSKGSGITVLQIGFETHKDQYIFYIKDNGIGINKENHEKIFGLFEKLNPESMGSGIGLALVKKIIEIHQGKVWVESWENGSIFKFYLNKKHIEEI